MIERSKKQMFLSLLNTKVLRLGNWLEQISFLRFTFLALAIAIFKIGVLGNGPEAIGWIRESANSFPEPSSWMSTSILQTLIFLILGNPSNIIWWGFSSLIWLVSLLAIGKLVTDGSQFKRHLILILLLTPVFSTTITMIGKYDIFIVLGIAIALQARIQITKLAGALIACSANPELTLISSLAILGIVFLPNLNRFRKSAFLLFSTSLISTLAGSIWLRENGINSRFSAATDFGDEWKHAIRSFLGYWPLAVFAGLGALWLVVGLCLLQLDKKNLKFALISCIGIPAISSFILTHDGTRVFAVVSVAPFFLLLTSVFRDQSVKPNELSLSIGLLFILLCVTPALIIDASGGIRVPYEEILNLLGWHGFWEQLPYDTIRNL
jgi:hypothetical protein